MQEYLSEAIVLNRESSGDLDSIFSLFTKRFGRLTARAKSARKITSKLSPHLQPGNIVRARLIEKNGLQLVDALKADRLAAEATNLYLLNSILPEAEPDPRLWQALMSGTFRWPEILHILGWDPKDASCEACSGGPAAFHIRGQNFFCMNCSSRLEQNEVIYIRNGN